MHYDAIHGRWIATVDVNARSAFSQVWFAISDTSDPTGGWTFYGFDADPTNQSWADFPGFGYNATWIAITNNMFPVSGAGLFDGAKMWVIDAASAVAGGALTVTVFPKFFDAVTTFFSFTLHPAVTFGPEPKLYLADLASLAGGLIRMSEITGTGPAPVWSPTAGSLMPGSGLFAPDNDFDYDIPGAEQLGVASVCFGGPFQPCRTALDCGGNACQRIDTGDVQMSATPVFRNGRLWIAHAGGLPVGAVDRNAVFWYELDPALMASSGAPIVQSGIIDGAPGSYLFYPSIAVNAADDVAIGFSRSDAGRYAQAAAATRASGSPPGSFGAVVQLKAGEGIYLETFGSDRNRWGDYSATVVDPADDLTFWTVQEYAALGNEWATWWAKLQVVVTCGDGVQEGGEECDDGNTLGGDCCSATCQAEAAGGACAADGNPCTDDVCDAAGACGVPNTLPCNDGSACTSGDICGAGTCSGAILTVTTATPARRTPAVRPPAAPTPLSRGPAAAPPAGLSCCSRTTPTTTARTSWSGSGSRAPRRSPSSARRRRPPTTCCASTPARPCSRRRSTSPPARRGGARSAASASSTATTAAAPTGCARARSRATSPARPGSSSRARAVPCPIPTLPPAAPVTVQLVNDTPGACWEATYTSNDVLRATNTAFKAKR